MRVNPVYYALRMFKKKFPEEYERRTRVVEREGAKGLEAYIFEKYRGLGKDFNCGMCVFCAGRYVALDFTPIVKCRYVPTLRPFAREPCFLFVPIWERR